MRVCRDVAMGGQTGAMPWGSDPAGGPGCARKHKITENINY